MERCSRSLEPEFYFVPRCSSSVWQNLLEFRRSIVIVLSGARFASAAVVVYTTLDERTKLTGVCPPPIQNV
jgi:hypothetical protein